MFLTQDEIIELTGRVQKSAQIRALAKMGINPRVDLDGIPHVTWEMVNNINYTKMQTSKPNFEALNNESATQT